MTAREDIIERIERVLKLTHKESITVTIPRLTAERAVSMLKEQGPMTPEKFKDGLLKMFSSIWECGIDHPMFQDTVGELMSGVMQLYKEAVKWDDK